MAATSTSDPGRDHLRRIAVIWAVASIVGVILVVFLLGPHMPPGRDTAEASDQTTANIILLGDLHADPARDLGVLHLRDRRVPPPPRRRR